MNADLAVQEPKEGELSLELIKKYINYCRTLVLMQLVTFYHFYFP